MTFNFCKKVNNIHIGDNDNHQLKDLSVDGCHVVTDMDKPIQANQMCSRIPHIPHIPSPVFTDVVLVSVLISFITSTT